MPPDLFIAAATTAERDEALAVLMEAAQRQLEQGARVWSTTELVEAADEALARGELHLVRQHGRAVAAFVLQWQDPLFWGEQPDDAGYLHKLAVARAAAGTGTGRAVLAWVEEHVSAAGRCFLRLDTDADNARLNAYYLAAGFTLCGVLPLVRGMRASLYEKAVC